MRGNFGVAALGAIGLLATACTGQDKGPNWWDKNDDTGETDDTGEDAGEDRDGDGYTSDEDCRDNDANSYPGAEETACDGIDQDCDGEDLLDGDGDGHGCEAYGGDDCDDYDADISPSATEVWYDGVDQNCDDNDSDADSDTYDAAEVGGDDCDDTNADINPGVEEVCYDDVDNDCDDATSDCDCDGDGYDAEDCGGDDCDDDDADLSPDGDETVVDGDDNDCDDEVDEDAYCHPYFPLSLESGHELVYISTSSAGNVYDEVSTVTGWDSATGEASNNRAFDDGAGTQFSVVEALQCTGDGVELEGWHVDQGGSTVATITYSAARLMLADEASLTDGATWEYSYAATEGTLGSGWDASGTFTVVGTESVTTAAGTFDALKVDNDYDFVDDTGYFDSREGVVSAWFVWHLGLVYSEDIYDDGTTGEVRELQSYTGYYP